MLKISTKRGNKTKESTPAGSAILFEQVRQKIITLRDNQVILDYAVAELYGVETMRINEAVKNNLDKFPDGYIVTLTKEDKERVIENFDNPKLKFSPVMPGLETSETKSSLEINFL